MLQGLAEARLIGRRADQPFEFAEVLPIGLAGFGIEGRGRVVGVEIHQHVGSQQKAVAADGVQALAGVAGGPGGQGG
ncbi:hypothetical protein D3C78_1525170 [compost metagenome]